RSGTSGIQRYGAAMWSADIGSNFDSLATHMNAQMHLALSGIDYFGSGVGGFHRGAITPDELNALYTVWFANSALLDVPVRPHTENLCNCKETAPDRVGDTASNLANIRLRYALAPYLYSLAHQAHLSGAPVVPPLLFYYQEDLAARPLGDHKLLGRDLLVRTATDAAAAEAGAVTAVYLPAGTWVDYHTGAWIESDGGWLADVPLWRDGLFRLPLYARAGAIVPQMHVDEQTLNLAGLRRDGSTRDELILYVVPAAEVTTFTLYEDDGRTTAYRAGDVRTTAISQQWADGRLVVRIGAADGRFAGAADARDTLLRMPLGEGEVTAVALDGADLPQYASRAAWEAADSGWFVEGGELWVRLGVRPVAAAAEVVVAAAADGPVVAADAPAAAADAPVGAANRTALYVGLGLAGLVVALGGWRYIRRRQRG
ncbi:MAG: DUF5110 domain-containing protein, partial [Anaerolineales bacterium]|nr:DUF5110 domain-containing protein [Anaerolineales bacterium]